jgi:hypothetical protein
VSRIEGRIGGKGKQSVDAADILAALAREAEKGPEERRDAVCRYLSASEGWREASNVLGGAFAGPETWLKAEREE